MNNVIWITHQDKTIGIIKNKDPITNEEFFYVGVGVGYNEISDYKRIEEWGRKIPCNIFITQLEVLPNGTA